MALQVQTNKPLPKKSATTSNFYQSTFMPIFQKAETRIKLLVLAAFLSMLGLELLRSQIDGVIKRVNKDIPKDLQDRESYIKGLKRTSEKYINQFYKPSMKSFKVTQEKLDKWNQGHEKKSQEIKIPKKPSESVDMWSKRKGAPPVTYYEKEIKARLEELADDPSLAVTPGKKSISLWQKAELDVRYNHQMEMLDGLKKDGVQYAYTSSHPNCSKRCEPWQGKLMHLTAHGDSNFKVGKLGNQTVYSLTDIMAQKDKYGYNNNIICGFNCRHRLIPYDGQLPPEKFSEEDVEKQRKIEEQIRAMEREIRKQKTRAALYEQMGEKRLAKAISEHVKDLIAEYRAFCDKNGYASYDYRITI